MNVLLLTLALLGCALAQYEPDCVCLDEVEAAAGLRSPTVFRWPPDGSNRRMIAEQIGIIWILQEDETMLPDPFMDLSDVVLAGQERGFLAFEFHPEFATNRKLYLYYSVEIGDSEYTRLSEIQASAADPNVVDYTTERIFMEIEQPFTNHNGGDLLFGLDGYMYIFLGDGGAAGDPNDNAQNVGTYLGSSLRIDVDTTSGNLEYGIPPDNPFLGVSGALPELYAMGLRNPWRVSMDMGDRNTGDGRGRIFIGDVGQNEYEEVDILQAGGNYGWAGREGMTCYKPELCGNTEPEVFPVAWYNHTFVGQCVIGGYVYRGCMNPNFNGWYFFADYSTHKLFRMLESSPDVWEWKEVFTCSTCPAGMTNEFGFYVQFFGEDYEGEVYFGTTETYSVISPVGAVYKIVDPSNTQPTCPASRRVQQPKH